MLQDSLSKIKYFLVLAFLLVIPMQAMAGNKSSIGFDLIDQTDTGVDRLIYYYDTVGRETYIQVTNTSDGFVGIHVQAFEADNNCNETDFDLCLTPGDTEIWNVEALPSTADLSESNGFIAISITDEINCGVERNALIGMFRIIDEGGYEYRTNAASGEDFASASSADYNVLNFNDVNGNNLSDVVGITYVNVDLDQVFASPLIGTFFGDVSEIQNLIFNDDEGPTSCSPALFTCSDNPGREINKGIDNSIPNSQAFSEICNTSKLDGPVIGAVDSGWLFLPFINYACFEALDQVPERCGEETGPPEDRIHFVGFLGINNGDGTGSMDSWLSHAFEIERTELPLETAN
jgi:hypothetical protein